jgi:hypothetical protein
VIGSPVPTSTDPARTSNWEGSPRLSRVEALDPTLEGAELFEGEHEDAMTDPIVIIQITLPVQREAPVITLKLPVEGSAKNG